MESIQVKDVSYQYTRRNENDEVIETLSALSDVSFSIEQGSFVCILGHNGSGKSTLAKLFNALQLPGEGTVLVSGMDSREEKNIFPIRREVGMVFQNPDNQFVGATVEDDVAFGLENQGIPVEEMKKRVSEALSLVGMAEFTKKEPARLSGGQKQRVAIAGVVALRPDILILDEATSMLDPEGRLELIKIVQKIRQDHQMTVISITHDLDEVAMSDRVLVMKKGKVESTSTPRELFSRSDLDQIGLDQPFVNQLKESLRTSGLNLPEFYLTEEELEEALWELF